VRVGNWLFFNSQTLSHKGNSKDLRVEAAMLQKDRQTRTEWGTPHGTYYKHVWYSSSKHVH